ncbi:MAG: hypothetical protein AAGF01_19225 [Cyanobacteria bacterium P01_G01_bin.38]
MSGTVLPQLTEAETLLSEQESALMQRLAEIQEKRKGLQTVITMFESSAAGREQLGSADLDQIDLNDAFAAAAAQVPESKAAANPTEISDPQGVNSEAKTNHDSDTKTAQKSADVARVKVYKESPQAKKLDGRAAQWQRYVLSDYQQQPLPNVVTTVLATRPKDSFKISDVMSTIFAEDIPKTQFLKARNRISNILSAGARNHEWYRGRGGTYSLSKAAVKAN